MTIGALVRGLIIVLGMMLWPLLWAQAKQVEHDALSKRVISLDYCADQYALMLAKGSQIKGLSPYSRARFSYYAAQAEA